MEENNENKAPQICFTRGGKDQLGDPQGETKDPIETIRAFIRDRFHQKNVYFLFGSGTSTPALPLMSGLYKQVEELFPNKDGGKEEKECTLEEKECTLFNEVKQAGDLEKTLGILYSLERYQAGMLSSREDQHSGLEITRNVIGKIQKHIYETLWHPTQEDLKEGQANSDNEYRSTNKYRSTLEDYKSFYQKVVYRNKDLSRVHIFTTNNDLFNETALDELGILYTNGFTPGLQRFFNPALFNFSYSRRMDVSIDKYEPIDNMVYLYKLHGSVNWRDQGAISSPNKLFSIQEVYSKDASQSTIGMDDVCLVYPAPTKQNLSLGSPYVDLIRLFQEKLLEHNSVLFVCGYSFGDEHINNVIYRALAVNASLNVVVLNDLKSDHPLRKTEDTRVYNIWSGPPKGGKDEAGHIHIHYFSEVVKKLLTDLDLAPNDAVLDKFVKEYSGYIKDNKQKQ